MGPARIFSIVSGKASDPCIQVSRPEASLQDPDIPWPQGSAWVDIKKYANASAHQAVAVARMAIEEAECPTQ